MTDEDFLKLVDEGVAQLSQAVRAQMGNLAIVIADAPTAEQREENGLDEDEVLFGLYEGVPQTERGYVDGPILPDKITIFKKPIIDTYTDPDDIAECVANTVWHEVAHHFGMDEATVAKEELRRNKFL